MAVFPHAIRNFYLANKGKIEDGTIGAFFKNFLFGNKGKIEDGTIGALGKNVLFGNESKTEKSSGVAPKGNSSPTTTQSGTGKIGAVGAAAQKDEELVNSAIRDIRNGKYTTQERKAAIERFQARIDKAVTAGVVPSQKDQQTFLNLREARAFDAYRSIKEQAKNPNAPAIVKDIASRPYEKDMYNPWKNFKRYDGDTILRVYGLSRPERMFDDQKDQKLQEIMREHPAARIAIEKTYGTTITPFRSPANAPTPSQEKSIDAMNNITKSKEWGPWDVQKPTARFKQYPDEPLNPRISKVTPFVDENTIYLNMTVDGKDKTLTVSNKNTVDAFHAGALPLNVLANKSLVLAEGMQADLHSRFEMAMDEQRGQQQGRSQGFQR